MKEVVGVVKRDVGRRGRVELGDGNENMAQLKLTSPKNLRSVKADRVRE